MTHSAVQSESKKIPLRFSDIFPKTVGNTTVIVRSYVCWTTNFCPVICSFDEVMPY